MTVIEHDRLMAELADLARHLIEERSSWDYEELVKVMSKRSRHFGDEARLALETEGFNISPEGLVSLPESAEV